MGVYLDRIENLSLEPYNFSLTLSQDTISQIADNGNRVTNGYYGIGTLTALWVMIYAHISSRENLFDLTPFQALVSTNAMIYTLGIVLVYLEFMTTPQHFIFLAGVTFLVNVFGILRS